MKVSKMFKQAMANAKLNSPSRYRHINRIWVEATQTYEYVRKNRGRLKQETATEE